MLSVVLRAVQRLAASAVRGQAENPKPKQLRPDGADQASRATLGITRIATLFQGAAWSQGFRV
jgi:hypothetical protein